MSFNNKVRLPEGKQESGIKEEEEQNSNLSWKLEKRDMESGKDLTASLVQTKPITPKAFFLQDLKQEEEKVENDFPRIEENDIRMGVGDVKYSIIFFLNFKFSPL